MSFAMSRIGGRLRASRGSSELLEYTYIDVHVHIHALLPVFPQFSSFFLSFF